MSELLQYLADVMSFVLACAAGLLTYRAFSETTFKKRVEFALYAIIFLLIVIAVNLDPTVNVQVNQ